jgi:phosphopantetheine adenylyltransferase
MEQQKDNIIDALTKVFKPESILLRNDSNSRQAERLNSEIETLFMTPSEEFANISSSLGREILSLGGDISPFVPAQVKTILLDTLQK